MTEAPQPPTVQPQQPAGSLPNAPGAVASMVCGIIGIFCVGLVLGIIALVMGIGAKKKIQQNPGMYGGNGMATAGVVLGIIDVVGWAILIAWVIGMAVAAAA